MPHASLMEVLGKLGKNPTEANFATIDLATRSLLDSGVYGWVNPLRKR